MVREENDLPLLQEAIAHEELNSQSSAVHLGGSHAPVLFSIIPLVTKLDSFVLFLIHF